MFSMLICKDEFCDLILPGRRSSGSSRMKGFLKLFTLDKVKVDLPIKHNAFFERETTHLSKIETMNAASFSGAQLLEPRGSR